MISNIKEAINIIEDVRKSMPECTNKAFLKGALNELNEALRKHSIVRPVSDVGGGLDEETFKTLSKLAIDNNTNLKSYIESVLVLHAGGGFKDKKPSPKRDTKK